jgi:hypothetical protein
MIGALMGSPTLAESVSIQTFQSQGGYGTAVTSELPIYRLHAADGVLVDDAGAKFSSVDPQWTSSTAQSKCTIANLRWAAVETTFYVVLASERDHILAVRSCGKSPYQKGGTSQYYDINASNLINHAQIAGLAGSTINPVIAAGEMDVIDGKPVYMDTCSGHFRPNVGSFLAYLSQSNLIPLTSALKVIAASGNITDDQISQNFTRMANTGSLIPLRNNRPGTGDCYSYTTVFAYSTAGNRVSLNGGLMALNQGPARVFQTDINSITNHNIRTIDLRPNHGVIYSYAAYVTTDWHIYNNSIQFYFTDETEDRYALSVRIFSEDHAVNYNSDKPNIKKIVFYIDW